MNSTPKNTLLNVPNILTLIRIILIPVFLWMVISHKAMESLLVFLLAGMTDFLDGMSARHWNLKTKIGAILDPAADKLLMSSSYIVLSLPGLEFQNTIPLWLMATVLGRDVFITAGALLLYKTRGYKSFLPTILGKISTVLQVGAIFMVLLFNYLEITPFYLSWIYYLTFLITLLSGIQYTSKGFRLFFSLKKA